MLRNDAAFFGTFVGTRLAYEVFVVAALLASSTTKAGDDDDSDTTSTSIGACTIEGICPARASWQKINDAVRNALAGVSLADVIPPPLPWIAARRDIDQPDVPLAPS